MPQQASDVRYAVRCSRQREYGTFGPPGRQVCGWHSVGFDVFEIVGHQGGSGVPFLWIRNVGWARDEAALAAMLAGLKHPSGQH